MPLQGPAIPHSKSASLARGDRRYARKVASSRRRQEIIDVKMGPCRVCVRLTATGLTVTFHHLVPKGSPYFGSDVEDNWVPLCGSGTSGHHGLVEARDRQVSRALLEGLSDGEYAYAVEQGGENFFERRYGLRYERSF